MHVFAYQFICISWLHFACLQSSTSSPAIAVDEGTAARLRLTLGITAWLWDTLMDCWNRLHQILSWIVYYKRSKVGTWYYKVRRLESQRKSKYWSTESRALMIDWSIVCCFSSHPSIFHSCRESPFSMKGRPNININHLLFMHSIFKAKESSDISHPLPTGYVASFTRSFHFQNT